MRQQAGGSYQWNRLGNGNAHDASVEELEPVCEPVCEYVPDSGQERLAEQAPARSSNRLPWVEAVIPSRSGRGGSDRIETARGRRLAPLSRVESLAALIHDARNMVAAIDLYCDLLEEAGVLAAPFRHYASELRLVGGTSRRLLDQLALLDLSAEARTDVDFDSSGDSSGDSRNDSRSDSRSDSRNGRPDSAASLSRPGRDTLLSCGEPIESLAVALQANQRLLSAVCGPGVTLGLTLCGGHFPVPMTGDDLTRVLINLCRNATEAMRGGGHIQIALEETPESLLLTFTDNGPGIPEAILGEIFEPGCSSHGGLDCVPMDGSSTLISESGAGSGGSGWHAPHRGLGLAIVRSIVFSAGGSVWAANRAGASATGAIVFLKFSLPEFHGPA
jgi:signal transduction histidine kinase